jgi:hypothetical protein
MQTATLETAYQSGRQELRVLLPDRYTSDRKYRTLYVLPVEPGAGQDFGCPLSILADMNAHNAYDLIVVQAQFEKEPWYGDHVSDPNIRQASYLTNSVIPFVERRYSTIGMPEARLLFGFSKGGWGAFSLILSRPDFFGYAASWDAPMMLDSLQFGMREVFGTRSRLDRYRPDLLAAVKRSHFQERTRLILAGENLWGTLIPAPGGGSHTARMHELLASDGVQHIYDNTLRCPHRWDSAWMARVLDKLVGLARGV